MTDASDGATDRALRDRLGAVSVPTTDLTPDPVAAVRRRVDRRRLRRWRRAALATAATILVVAGTIALIDGGRDDESLDVVSPSTVEHPTTTTPISPPSSAPTTTTSPEPPTPPPGSPPIPFRDVVSLAWTGSEVVVDDVAAFEPASETWRTLAPSPLPEVVDAPVTSTMTDLGLVVVKGTATAVWDPVADTWRRLDDAPAPAPSPEGETPSQVLDLAGDGDRAISHSANAALDVAAGTWTPFDDPPVELARAATVWTGEELIAVGGPGTPFTSAAAIAIDPDDGTWRTLPSPPGELRAEGLGASWDGQRVVVANYDMTAATYDPGTDTWTALSAIPARFSERSPLVASTDRTTVTLMSQAVAVLDDDRWVPFPYGLLDEGPIVSLDDTGRVATWGADDEANTNTLTVTDLGALVATPRRQAGAGSVELGPGDTLTGASYDDTNGLVQTVALTVATDTGGTCTVASTYLGAVGPAIDQPVRETIPGADGPITWARDDAGTTWEAEATTSDLFRISCDRPEDARRLAATTRFS